MGVKRKKITNISSGSRLFAPRVLGNSIGVVSSIFLLGAAFMSWIALSSGSSYNADVIAIQFPLSFSVYDWTIIAGFIQTYVFGYLAGLLIAFFYNRRMF